MGDHLTEAQISVAHREFLAGSFYQSFTVKET